MDNAFQAGKCLRQKLLRIETRIKPPNYTEIVSAIFTLSARRSTTTSILHIPPSMSASSSDSLKDKAELQAVAGASQTRNPLSIRGIRNSMSHTSPQVSSAISSNTKNQKEKKPSLLDVFSVKEPSAKALQRYEEQIRKQQAATAGGKNNRIGVGMPMISSTKLPTDIPKVNTKWDGMPKTSEKSVARYTPTSNSSLGSESISSNSSLFGKDSRLQRLARGNPPATSSSNTKSLTIDPYKVSLRRASAYTIGEPSKSQSSCSIISNLDTLNIGSPSPSYQSSKTSAAQSPIQATHEEVPPTRDLNASNVLADMCSGYNQKHTTRLRHQEIDHEILLRLDSMDGMDDDDDVDVYPDDEESIKKVEKSGLEGLVKKMRNKIPRGKVRRGD